MPSSSYFLPYQRRWLADRSLVKLWEKSRRIGATYVQSYEDVRDCATGRVPKVWFSSADESAAREYIDYCARWAKVLQLAAGDLGQMVLSSAKAAGTYGIEFANGSKIHALSSNPKAFRSKGGKVVLDEFAWHDDADALWAAARPAVTWGYPLRIISTHNGTNCRYYKFVESCKQGRLNWSLHATPIDLAVEEGLAERIEGRSLDAEGRAAWLNRERKNAGDAETWLQEYCCCPVDESTAFLSYELLARQSREGLCGPLDELAGDLYLGVDIGRKKDLSVFWLLERQEHLTLTRCVKTLERASFSQQREALFSLLARRDLRRACLDSTGIGMQLAEEALIKFGKYRVEPLNFSAPLKESLAYALRSQLEDASLLIPDEVEIREDLHSVRKVLSPSGNVRFDVAASQGDGHADRFWALALALRAAQNPPSVPLAFSRARREQVG